MLVDLGDLDGGLLDIVGRLEALFTNAHLDLGSKLRTVDGVGHDAVVTTATADLLEFTDRLARIR